MLKRTSAKWTPKTLQKLVAKNEINFDMAIQRTLVWDATRKSLLIHSMIEGYPIPPFFANRTEEKVNDMLDGKQRGMTVLSFINDEFPLTNCPPVSVEVENTDEETGEKTTSIEEVSINAMKYSELAQEFKDAINEYTFDVIIFDNASDEEVVEMFVRLNNGKPLSAIEAIRAQAKSLDMIVALSKHDLFNIKTYTRQSQEGIIIKAWALLNSPNPSFESKVIKPLTRDAEITLPQAQQLTNAFTRLLNVYHTIKNTVNDVDQKIQEKVANKVLTQTHLLALLPMAVKSMDEGFSPLEFAQWVTHFFMGRKGASISEEYNSLASSNTANALSVQRRMKIVANSYNAWFTKRTKVADSAKDAEAIKAEADMQKVENAIVDKALDEQSALAEIVSEDSAGIEQSIADLTEEVKDEAKAEEIADEAKAEDTAKAEEVKDEKDTLVI